MQPLQDIVTDLKLRAGWGMNGNQGGFGNYAYMASMSASKLPVSEGNLYPGLAIRPGSAPTVCTFAPQELPLLSPVPHGTADSGADIHYLI